MNILAAIEGRVVEGKRMGRKLGFPTANIKPDDAVDLPVNGVYAAWIYVGDDIPRICVLNQGTHPTLPEGPPTIEAHILDFSGDIYGRRVRVDYAGFIRPETRFGSLDELKEQIARDVETARAMLGRRGEQEK